MDQNYLQYGDIIFINAPTKPLLDNKTFYIDYIKDSSRKRDRKKNYKP